MPRPVNSLLTDHELKILKILWAKSPQSIADILAKFAEDLKPAYNSLLTAVRSLEAKGVVSHAKRGKGHEYFPLLTKKAYQKRALKKLVSSLFDGNAFAAAAGVLGKDTLSAKDLKKLKDMMET